MHSALKFLAIKDVNRFKDGNHGILCVMKEPAVPLAFVACGRQKKMPFLASFAGIGPRYLPRMQSEVQRVCRGERWSVHAKTFEKQFAALSLTGVKLL